MNIAAILALLLNSGLCTKSDFHTGDGGTLRIVVCPLSLPSTQHAPDGDAPDAVAPPARPATRTGLQVIR